MEALRQKFVHDTGPKKPGEFVKKSGVERGGMGDDLRTTRSRPAQPEPRRPSTARSGTTSSMQLRESTSKRVNTIVSEEEAVDSSADPIDCFSSPPPVPPRKAAPPRSSTIPKFKPPGKAQPKLGSSTAATRASEGSRPTPATTKTRNMASNLTKENEPVSQGSSPDLSAQGGATARPFPMSLDNDHSPARDKTSLKAFPMSLDRGKPLPTEKAVAGGFPMQLRKEATDGKDEVSAKVFPMSLTEAKRTKPTNTTKTRPFPVPLSPKKTGASRKQSAQASPVLHRTAEADSLQTKMSTIPERTTNGTPSSPTMRPQEKKKGPVPKVASSAISRSPPQAALAQDDEAPQAAQAFPMRLPPQKPQSTGIRGKKRESPKSKARLEREERAAKKTRVEEKNSKPGVKDTTVPTGGMGSLRLNSSQSSLSSGEPEPKELCPFCDEPWPEQPSKRLIALLEQVKTHAWQTPRYSNPNGLSAPMEIFVTLCTLHRSESSHIPEGIAEGWPTKIDFSAIPGRLQKQMKRLEKLILSPSTSPFFQAAKNDIEEKGARVAASVFGQYETFERCQPGYYGERGMVVILGALASLFPDILASSCEPLSVDDFTRQVLVPEAALLLIREDMKLDRAGALAVLLKSRKYGIAQFPDRDAGETHDVSMSPIHLRVSSTTEDSPVETKIRTSQQTAGVKAKKRVLQPSKAEWKFDLSNDELSSDLEIEEDVPSTRIQKRAGGVSDQGKEEDDSWVLSSSEDESSDTKNDESLAREESMEL